MSNLLHSVWDFLADEKNRAILSWLGGGLSVVIAALWTAYAFSKKQNEIPPTVISPEHIASLVKSASEPQTQQLSAERLDLAKKLGVHENAVAGMLRILGEKEIPVELLPLRLAEIAKRYSELLQQLQALQSDDPEVERLRTKALSALQQGEYDQADSSLNKAQEIDISALDAQERKLNARKLSAAQTMVTRGVLEASRLNYRQAAAHYAMAASIVPPESQEHWAYLREQACATYRQGYEFGDNQALREAIGLWQNVLALRSRDKHSLDWARTQNNLGLALAALGGRELDTARLEEAVSAYRAALEEGTHAQAPLVWAAIQNNLGLALATLGGRESDTTRLEEAVSAYRAALEERTRKQAPLDWAATQNNLGNALERLGERESDTTLLKEAVSAYRAALEERTRERAPLDWAATQNNLGAALQALGRRESDTQRLEEAVSAYRAALEEITRERAPLTWAATQNNLGAALQALGERESNTAWLDEAVFAYRAALKERTRERAPLDWAATQNNLGNALATLGILESDAHRLEEAVSAYRVALEERGREQAPLDWAATQNNLGEALTALAELESDTQNLEEAATCLRGAIEVFSNADTTPWLQEAQKHLARVEKLLLRTAE